MRGTPCRSYLISSLRSEREEEAEIECAHDLGCRTRCTPGLSGVASLGSSSHYTFFELSRLLSNDDGWPAGDPYCRLSCGAPAVARNRAS